MASPMSTSSSAREKSTLLAIPHELLFNILTNVGPEDLDSLQLTCRDLKAFVRGSGGGNGGIFRGVLRGTFVVCEISSFYWVLFFLSWGGEGGEREDG